MEIKRIFIADDGTNFDQEFECLLYEDRCLAPRLSLLKEYITLFGYHGDVLPYNVFVKPSYVYVKQLPNRQDADFMYLWEKLLGKRFSDIVNVYQKTGWYIKGRDDRWYCWDTIEQDYCKTLTLITKMNENV